MTSKCRCPHQALHPLLLPLLLVLCGHWVLMCQRLTTCLMQQSMVTWRLLRTSLPLERCAADALR